VGDQENEDNLSIPHTNLCAWFCVEGLRTKDVSAERMKLEVTEFKISRTVHCLNCICAYIIVDSVQQSVYLNSAAVHSVLKDQLHFTLS
jgi:hypothetical protein